MNRCLELAEQINRRLGESGSPTIAAAESCSGGGFAASITAHAGSSAYFLGSIVAYVNDAKAKLLGVSSAILSERGAVSPECAEAMARGARTAFGSDLGVSTTGIAGPTGATDRKPIGLVYTALANETSVHVQEHHFSGDRQAVTVAAIEAALIMLIVELDRRDAGHRTR